MADASHGAMQQENWFVSAFDRKRLHELAAQELAACDAGDLREALRLSEAYEQAEAEALGLKARGPRAVGTAAPLIERYLDLH